MAKNLHTTSTTSNGTIAGPTSLPCHGIVIRTIGPNRRAIGSTMRRALPVPDEFDEILDYLEALKRTEAINTRVRALEALILSHSCAGVDIQSDEYCAGIEAAYTAITSY